MRRTRYQFGSVRQEQRKNGHDVWVYRRYVDTQTGRKRVKTILGTIIELPTRADAERAAELLRIDANPTNPKAQGMTFGALLDRYIREEMPERFSTSSAYKHYIENHIRPKWGKKQIPEVRPVLVRDWLKTLPLAPKSKGHILTVLRNAFRCAMLWEYIDVQANPMEIIRIKGISKRLKKATTLTIPQVRALIEGIEKEPYRTMAQTAFCLGLLGSEVCGLQWGDLGEDSVHIQRGIVSGRVGDTKNDFRDAVMPLHKSLRTVLEIWKAKTVYNRDSDWIFASDYFGGKKPIQPWHAMENHIDAAAKRLGYGPIGWKGVRRTYSSILRELDVDLKVQQELMRHADIRTTMNLYTDAPTSAKREAHGKLVSEVIQ